MRKRNQKGLSPIAVVLIIAILLVGYLVYQNQTKITQTPSAQSSTSNNEMATWKTFIKNDLTLKYPPNWEANEFISEVAFTSGEQDKSKVYNIIGINKYPTQLYEGYTNSEWFNKISNLTEPLSDQREIRTKIASGNIASREPYVIFKDESSATAKAEIFKQVKAYILKDQTIYQLRLDLYDNNGLEVFKKIVASAVIDGNQ